MHTTHLYNTKNETRKIQHQQTENLEWIKIVSKVGENVLHKDNVSKIQRNITLIEFILHTFSLYNPKKYNTKKYNTKNTTQKKQYKNTIRKIQQ